MATNTSKESNENTENTTEDHKIVVIGGNKVGKTTIVQQFLKKQEKANYREMGIRKVVLAEQEIQFKLVDIGPGSADKLPELFKSALGAIVVCDVSDITASLKTAKKWKKIFNKIVTINDKPLPCVLFANKIDLLQGDCSKITNQLGSFAKDNEFAGWAGTCAMNDVGLECGTDCLLKAINKFLLENVKAVLPAHPLLTPRGPVGSAEPAAVQMEGFCLCAIQ